MHGYIVDFIAHEGYSPREIGDNLKWKSAMKINKHPAYIVYKSQL